MVNQQLLGYIKEQIKEGVNNEDIKRVLLQSGWNDADVDEAFISLQNPILTSSVPISPPSPVQPNLSKKTEGGQGEVLIKKYTRKGKLILLSILALAILSGIIFAMLRGGGTDGVVKKIQQEEVDSNQNTQKVREFLENLSDETLRELLDDGGYTDIAELEKELKTLSDAELEVMINTIKLINSDEFKKNIDALNEARQKGKEKYLKGEEREPLYTATNAGVEEILGLLAIEQDLFLEDSNNQYGGYGIETKSCSTQGSLFASPTIARIISEAEKAGAGIATCVSDDGTSGIGVAGSWAVSVQMNNGNDWCVDQRGNSGIGTVMISSNTASCSLRSDLN